MDEHNSPAQPQAQTGLLLIGSALISAAVTGQIDVRGLVAEVNAD